ncbi:MAG TPA: hypothetical protein VE091_10850 [Gemmatimonadales bacterium]|nr:hypothetical protein [Gemmatimonadales bacterium]
MTGDSTQLHLTSDDVDAWLAGVAAPELQRHVDQCSACFELVQAEQALAAQLGTLPLYTPKVDFANRVMASVYIPDPFAIRSLQAARRRLLGSRKAIALAASLALVLLGSMSASAAWTLANRDTLVAAGNWLAGQAAGWAWLGLRSAVLNLIEQPWFAGFRSLVETPGRLAIASAALSLMYLSGILALRRLLAVPPRPVAHANR